jgi:hypothetical protein
MSDDFPGGNAESEVQDEQDLTGVTSSIPQEGITLQKAATWGTAGLLAYFFGVAIFGGKGR